jgi:hypothetical protein
MYEIEWIENHRRHDVGVCGALIACGFNLTNPGTLTRVTGSGKVVLVGKIDQLNVTLGGAGAAHAPSALTQSASTLA